MRSVRFVCLFAMLISMLVLEQSSRAQLENQRNGLPIAQQWHPVLPLNFLQMPQGAPFPMLRARTFEAVATRRKGLPMQGGPNFAPAVTYSSGGWEAYSVAVADVNGDGKPDLLVANVFTSTSNFNNGTVGVLLGNGDGTFQTAVAYGSGGYAPLSVAVADVNGDGKPDLLVANECGDNNCVTNGTVGVLLGNGDGTFQTAVPYGSGGYPAYSVAVADVNGDGKPDLLVANECGDNNCVTNSTVGVLLGNGDGTFQTAVPYGSGGYVPLSVAVADVNGDGKPDLAVANLCGSDNSCNTGSVGVLLGNGDGTFQTAVAYGSGGYAFDGSPSTYSVAVADVNGDGKPDLLVANSCVSSSNCNNGTVGVLLGNGDGTFQTAVAYSSGSYIAQSLSVADVNGDGKPDLLVANCSNATVGGGGCIGALGAVGVLLGNGNGTFQNPVMYATGGSDAIAIAVADVNGDGKPDLLIANYVSSSVGVLINTSVGSTTTALTSSPNPSSLEQAVTFMATVTPSQFFEFQPTGTVTFTYGSTTLCNAVTLSGGTATCTYSNLPAGTDTVSAAYSGDANFTPSSGTVNQTVNVTFAGLIELVKQFVTKPGVRAIMVATLELAQAAERAHAVKLADELLDAFIHEVMEQSGKSLTATQAAILIQDAKALMM